jgi:hypothetical protein
MKWLSIKIPQDTYELVQELVTATNREGWRALGIDRSDRPGLGLVIDEAVRLLAARRKGGRRARVA